MDSIRPWLYIGKYRETLDQRLLADFGIGAMLLLAEPVEHPGIASLYLAVEDLEPVPPEQLRRGVDFVRGQKHLGRTILIACGAGINRSSVFAISTLKEEEGLSLWDAFRAVKAAHPEAMPHPPAWDSLCQYYQESVPYLDVMRAQ